MTRVHGFPPVAHADARILILGSMPGIASLRAGRYYAHPRNAFWRIAGAIFGFSAELEYEERTRMLVRNRVALWDVLAACTREGSLDSAIDDASIIPNDFRTFLADHPQIETVCFNGAKAEASYLRYVLPTLHEQQAGLSLHRLPSTSPANAAQSYDNKLAAWRRAFGCGES